MTTLHLRNYTNPGQGVPLYQDIPARGDANGALMVSGMGAASPTIATSRIVSLLAAPQIIKASPGGLWGLNIYNPNTVDAFVKIYDSASPTVGTTAPVFVVQCPAGGTVLAVLEQRAILTFASALAAAATTGFADSSTAAPTTGLMFWASWS